jgi:hypothetical protein
MISPELSERAAAEQRSAAPSEPHHFDLLVHTRKIAVIAQSVERGGRCYMMVRITAAQDGGVTSRRRWSNGLGVPPIVVVATCV